MERLAVTPRLFSCRRDVTMEDLGENTTVLCSLRSLNNFISQRVEGGIGRDASTSAPGSLQMQYQHSMQVSARGGVGLWVRTPVLRWGPFQVCVSQVSATCWDRVSR